MRDGQAGKRPIDVRNTGVNNRTAARFTDIAGFEPGRVAVAEDDIPAGEGKAEIVQRFNVASITCS